MDDLMKCLYEFLLDRRMDGLWEDEQYKACRLAAELQEEKVMSSLDESQRGELDRLLDMVAEQGSAEQTHLFRATLNLVREWNALVGA